MATRRDIRRSAFLLTFEKLFLEDPLENIFESAEEFDEIIIINDEVKELVAGIFEKQEELDGIIGGFSNKRAVSRIPKIDLAILRVAIYELLYNDKVPVNAAISEAVKLAEKYALDADVSFINGVLGSFSKSIAERDK